MTKIREEKDALTFAQNVQRIQDAKKTLLTRLYVEVKLNKMASDLVVKILFKEKQVTIKRRRARQALTKLDLKQKE